MKWFYCPTLIILFLLPTTALAADWPARRMDQTNRNSTLDQPNLPLTELGNFPSQYITPLIVGNIVVTADSDVFGRKLVAYQVDTLKKRWEFRLNSYYPKQPVIDKGTLYFGVANQPQLFAVSLITGALRWQVTIPNEDGGAKFAPVVIGDQLFVAATWLNRFSIDGQWQWGGRYVVDSPMATNSTSLYLRTHDLKLYKLKPSTGDVLWAYATNSTAGTEPVVTADTVYVGMYQKIAAIDETTGLKRWDLDLGPASPMIGNLAVAGDHLFVSTNAGLIESFDSHGSLLWSNRFNTDSNDGNGWQPFFVVAGDRLLTRANQTNQLMLDALTGQTTFQGSLGYPSATFQAVAEQRLWLNQDNVTHVFTATGWTAGTLGDPVETKRLDPVIIVPGILESWPVNGVWQLDPVFHTFDGLLLAFHKAGYVDNQTLFTFAYDWHKSNDQTAADLATLVAGVRVQTGAGYVDLVAHSMGALVARAFIASPLYLRDVDELVMIAPPNQGSVKSYLTWEAGVTGTGKVDALKADFLKYESQKAGYGGNVVGYLQQNVPSLNQLLPIFSYLQPVHAELQPYRPCASTYPCNPFLEQLQTTLDFLERQVSLFNVIGQTSTSSTLQKLIISDSTMPGLWQHGMPLGYPQADGLVYGPGDGTVLTSSAHLDGVEESVITAEHSAILTDAARAVVKRLSERDVGPIQAKTSPLRYLFVKLFSPINMLLTDSQGRRVGIDPSTGRLVNEIPGAFYSGGGQTEEYTILPDPGPADYRLDLQGTGQGSYQITGSLIDDSQTVEASQSGTTALAENHPYQLTIQPQLTIEPILPSPTPPPSPSPCPSSGAGSGETISPSP